MSWVNKCPVRLLKITLPLSTSSNSYSMAAGLFADSGFRHSQPNLLRETQVIRLGAQQVNNGQWIHPPHVRKITS